MKAKVPAPLCINTCLGSPAAPKVLQGDLRGHGESLVNKLANEYTLYRNKIFLFSLPVSTSSPLACVTGIFAQHEKNCIVVKPTLVHRVPAVGKGDVNYQADVGVLLWVHAEPFSTTPESLPGYFRAKIKVWHLIERCSWKPNGCE